MKRLINHVSLTRRLRQLLVLLTLLLLPAGMWAENVTTYTFTGTSVSSEQGCTYDVASTVGGVSKTWRVKNLSAKDESYENNRETSGYQLSTSSFGISNIDATSTSGTVVEFALESDFTLIGQFVSAKITYSTTSMSRCEAVVNKVNKSSGNYANLTTYNQALGESPTTLSLGDDYVADRIFEGNKIALEFRFTTDKYDGSTGSFTIESIEITTNPIDYNLWIAGTQVTSDNASTGITGDYIIGTVTYDAENKKLTLDNAEITGFIYSSLEELTIELTGTNTINGGIQFRSSNEVSEGDLNFTGTGSLEMTGQDSDYPVKYFTDVTIGSGLYLQTNEPGTHWDSSSQRFEANGNGLSSLTITSAAYYPIWVISDGVNYIQVSGENKDHVLGEGNTKVTYDSVNDKLILNNFECATTDGEYAICLGGQEEFKIHILGENRISGGGVSFVNEVASLVFSTDAQTPGTLTIVQPQEGYYPLTSIGDGAVSYENGLGYTNYVVSTAWTRLKIGETEITGTTQTVVGYENVSFDATKNTLTLSGATIPAEVEGIKVYADNLIVEISDDNTINGTISYYGQNFDTSSIQIKKASGAESASLKVTNVEGFTSCTWGEGLYLSAQDAQGAAIDVHYKHSEGEGGSMQSYYGEIAEVTFSTTQPSNTIWVNGISPNADGNFIDPTTSQPIEGLSFNASKSTLTLTNASISTNDNHPSPIIVCNGDLTVNLVGEDNQVYFNGYYGTYTFKNNGATGILTFTGEGTLHINSEYDEGTYFGLCDGFSTVDFGDLAYTINGDSKKISPLDISTPMMNVHEGKIAFITEGYLFGSTTYYKIVYADGSGNEEEVPLTNSDWSNYNEKITISELTGPCTVYAYTKYKTETGNSAKAKHFRFTEPLTITYNGTAFELTTADLPAIFPAIEEGDDVTYQIGGVSQGTAVNYDEQTQKYMVQGYGSAVLNIFIGQGDYTPYQVLNEVASLTVNVVAALDFEFVDDNSWASYYATENLTVPTGLTAYVVSDVDEESGAVTVTSIGYIPKNNAVLLEREQNGAASGYTAGAYTGTTTTVNNLLSGSPNTTDISSLGSGPVYVLFNDKFKRAINGTIPARRAYLALNAAVAPVSAPQYLTISITDGNTTAIDTLTVDDNSNDSWYTIDGLKLKGKPQRKGLYINNGKKVYINNNK